MRARAPYLPIERGYIRLIVSLERPLKVGNEKDLFSSQAVLDSNHGQTNVSIT